MDPLSLIPSAGEIPAPAWFLDVLETLLFTLHLLVINVMAGGMLIVLFSRLKNDAIPLHEQFHAPLPSKLPTSIAIGVNLGVAPLLFLQVLYGHLFYTSSILIAVYWILVIPLLILAYYGSYIHTRKYSGGPLLSKISLAVSALIVLYILLMFVNNMTLMAQPEKWIAYFDNRKGTILNLSDPTMVPRYFHFLTASVAVAGLFLALAWRMRREKKGDVSDGFIRKGLHIFGSATLVQVGFGLWFLMAIPKSFMLQFMGGDLWATIIFGVAFFTAIGSIASAFANRFNITFFLFLATMVLMVITRHQLRGMYLAGKFELSSLELSPQYGALILFLLVLVAGLAAVGYMLRLYFNANPGRVTR